LARPHDHISFIDVNFRALAHCPLKPKCTLGI
jgi:hypothetical protein